MLESTSSSDSEDEGLTLGSLLKQKQARAHPSIAKTQVGGGKKLYNATKPQRPGSSNLRKIAKRPTRPAPRDALRRPKNVARQRKRRVFDDSSESEDLPMRNALSSRKRPAPANVRGAGQPPSKRARTSVPGRARTSVPKARSRPAGSSSATSGGSSKNQRYEGQPVSTYPKKPHPPVALTPDQNAPKWWETEPYKGNIKWKSMDHNGIIFPPPYVPHGTKILYKGKPVELTPAQEELAGFYAMRIKTDWVKKKQYNINFFREFRRELMNPDGSITHAEITEFKHINFQPIYDWMMKKKEEEKERKKDALYRKKLKADKAAVDKIYGWAVVDGVSEKIGNYRVEPPGLFQGRGEHPKMGMHKHRLKPSQITLNIGKGLPIPKCPAEGEEWGKITHDPTVTYIAKWVENINGAHKMVYLHASSRFKGQSDMAKYDKARKLKKHINRIREDYTKMLTSKDNRCRQLATCVYIIDILSIRVGNEKDTDEEADTVGVCSFRVEHLTEFVKYPDGKCTVTLDFLGKDSMRYCATCEVPEQIFKNMASFCKGKKKDVDVFEKVDPGMVNDYLKTQMPGLSAKVFRTHNASTTLEAELKKMKGFQLANRKCNITVKTLIHEKKYFYDVCNKQVAILCNHKKTVNKERFDISAARMDEKIKKAEAAVKELRRKYAIASGKKKPKTKEEKVFVNKDPKSFKKQLEKKKSAVQKLKMAKDLKIENKEVALGTSKINYMDPRITVAFCKRLELPIEKVFNKALLDKFPWAMAASPDYEF